MLAIMSSACQIEEDWNDCQYLTETLSMDKHQISLAKPCMRITANQTRHCLSQILSSVGSQFHAGSSIRVVFLSFCILILMCSKHGKVLVWQYSFDCFCKVEKSVCNFIV